MNRVSTLPHVVRMIVSGAAPLARRLDVVQVLSPGGRRLATRHIAGVNTQAQEIMRDHAAAIAPAIATAQQDGRKA